ncbi:putative RNA-directed DNA polymerase [Tanacetum coccineum]|uniref:RNA-directed DNA polymerase n=1 Tax=Tanacetum coccineum TaxID=301880 RepID=A0ABQ5A6W4_9ASTR
MDLDVKWFSMYKRVSDHSWMESGYCKGMRDFQECVNDIEMSDINSSGLKYTWTQKPKGDDGILKKIDRVMANLKFYELFVGACAYFQPYRISDHSPAVLKVPMSSNRKHQPFKFYNVLTHHSRFREIVATGWNVSTSGFWMYKVVKRLKTLKKPLRKLMYEQGNLHDKVKVLRAELDEAQKALDLDPNNLELREDAAAYLLAFNDALLTEERFLSQKAKVEWLKLGDANSAYFYKVVKGQASRNRIDCVTTSEGVCLDGDQVPLIFIDHYTSFLGQPGITTDLDTNGLFSNKLSDEEALHMIRDISNQEVRDAMFSIGDNKAPGPDGYSSAFFKESWEIVGTDITKAVKEFFYQRRILSNRMKDCLQHLVSLNQSAFVLGRRISDNILLTQELMHNYHLDRGVPRCAFKVDIQKAYDTVDWNFLRNVLINFDFYSRMISWIMECVTTTSFSISINGSLHGYFKGKRGLPRFAPRMWDCIRPGRDAEVNLRVFMSVWFSQRIPRHAIHLWLVVNRKLKTQDLLRQWDVKNSGITMFNFPLCEGEPDSHNHLFFGCNSIRFPPFRSVVCKLVFAVLATLYAARRGNRKGECSDNDAPSVLEVAESAYLSSILCLDG